MGNALAVMPLLLLILAFAISLGFRLQRGAGPSRLWQAVLLIYFLALAIQMYASQIQAPLFENKLFLFSASNSQLGMVFMLGSMLAHINFSQDKEGLFQQWLPLHLALAILCQALVFSHNILAWAFLFPVAMLLAGIAPLVSAKESRLQSNIHWTVFLSCILLALISLSIALFYGVFGALTFDELKTLFIEPKQRVSFVLGWGLMAIVLFAGLMGPPFHFFNKEYDRANSWSLFTGFRQQIIVLSTVLLSKWIMILESSTFLKDVFGAWPGHFPRIGLSLFLVASIVVIVHGAVFKKSSNMVNYILAQPLLLFFFSVGLGDKAARSWGFMGLLIAVFAQGLLSLVLSEISLPLGSPYSRLAMAIKQSPLRVRTTVMFVLFALAPMGNFFSFELLRTFAKTWTAQIPFGSSTLRDVVFIGVLCVFVCQTMTMSFLATRVFSASLERGVIEYDTPKLQEIWNVCLLIPFIFVGIYPVPLYNYVVVTFG